MKTENLSIEKKNYVATPADIEALAESQSNHLNASRWQLPATYLRALIATTQHELGIKSIKREPVRPGDEVIQQQLTALAKVQERFYEAVKRGAAKAPVSAEDTRDPAIVQNSRCVFARTSYSTLRNWLLRGRFGLEGLSPKQATKRALYESTPKPERIATFREKLFVQQADRILTAVKAQAAVNRDMAVNALQGIIDRLSDGLAGIVQSTPIRLGGPTVGATFVGSRTIVTPAERAALAARPRGRPPKPRVAARRSASARRSAA
jgi:hypothetical protein